MKKLLLSFAVGLGLLGSGFWALAQSPGVNSNFPVTWSIPLDSSKRTYSMGMSNLVVASSPTTYWQLCGSSYLNCPSHPHHHRRSTNRCGCG